MISPLRLFDLRTTDVLAYAAVYQAVFGWPCQFGQTAARSACGGVTYSTSLTVVISKTSSPTRTKPSRTCTAVLALAVLIVKRPPLPCARQFRSCLRSVREAPQER